MRLETGVKIPYVAKHALRKIGGILLREFLICFRIDKKGPGALKFILSFSRANLLLEMETSRKIKPKNHYE